jgi:hypothetical protein
MPTPRFVCRVGTLLALAATTMAAQTNLTDWNAVKALKAGTDIRITANSRTIRGTIDSITGDFLVMTSGKSQEMFDRQQVSSVAEKKPGHRMRNALIGLAAGTGAGLGIGLGARSSHNELQIVPNHTLTAAFALAGAATGTILGALIPTGGWREIYKK